MLMRLNESFLQRDINPRAQYLETAASRLCPCSPSTRRSRLGSCWTKFGGLDGTISARLIYQN